MLPVGFSLKGHMECGGYTMFSSLPVLMHHFGTQYVQPQVTYVPVRGSKAGAGLYLQDSATL
jgi:hypothetical protein